MKTQKIKLNETQKKAVQFLILAALVSVIIFVPQLRVLADDGAQMVQPLLQEHLVIL